MAAVSPTASSELCTCTVSQTATKLAGHPRRSASSRVAITVVPSTSVSTAWTPSPRATGSGNDTTVTSSARRSILIDANILARSISPGETDEFPSDTVTRPTWRGRHAWRRQQRRRGQRHRRFHGQRDVRSLRAPSRWKTLPCRSLIPLEPVH